MNSGQLNFTSNFVKHAETQSEMFMTFTQLAGIGHYVPKQVITNEDLKQWMETSDEWIVERTGIKERRYANVPEETTSWMGAQAAKMALAQAEKSSKDIDLIIFATLSPEYFFPGSGCVMHEFLDLNGNVPSLDIRQQCSGFVYGLQIADAFIKTGMYHCILLVGSEVQSTSLNKSTEGRDVAVIFGDGAGAAILTPTHNLEHAILSHSMHAEGKWVKELWCEAPTILDSQRVTHEMVDSGRHYPRMNGRYVFKHAVTRFPEVIKESLDKIGKTIADIDILIPHQANKRITEAVGTALGISSEKVISNIHKYGNTTAASIPIAFSEAVEEGKLKKGDLVVLAAFGAGFTWGSVILRY